MSYKCVICGRLLSKTWAIKCFDCYKKTEFEKKDIKELLKKYSGVKK